MGTKVLIYQLNPSGWLGGLEAMTEHLARIKALECTHVWLRRTIQDDGVSQFINMAGRVNLKVILDPSPKSGNIFAKEVKTSKKPLTIKVLSDSTFGNHPEEYVDEEGIDYYINTAILDKARDFTPEGDQSGILLSPSLRRFDEEFLTPYVKTHPHLMLTFAWPGKPRIKSLFHNADNCYLTRRFFRKELSALCVYQGQEINDDSSIIDLKAYHGQELGEPFSQLGYFKRFAHEWLTGEKDPIFASLDATEESEN